MYYAMCQQAKGKHSLRSPHQDSPGVVRAHRWWQEAKGERASPGRERQRAAPARHVAKEAFPSKRWKQNIFLIFFQRLSQGIIEPSHSKGRSKTAAPQSLTKPSINSSELSARCPPREGASFPWSARPQLFYLSAFPIASVPPARLRMPDAAAASPRARGASGLIWVGWEGAGTPPVICFSELTAELRN